ncbi:MAG: 16S rRNA (cytosine(967)-C(5))-methyltransferase RsmB [Gammaproteobacteria bacterium]|nr:16S rRNA (cytosine(967)-C(5))-methyltransferase RsmB [Gammaproteobacteria bacterium]
MSHSPNSRAIAATLVAEVLLKKRSLQQVFSEQTKGLDPVDSAFVQALVYGVLREYGNLQAITKQLLTKPLKPIDQDISIIIAVGLYQLMSMRVAEHAAVSETVEAAKIIDKQWATGLINGLLRRFVREKAAIIKLAKLSADKNNPSWLVAKIKAAWPDRSLQIMQKNDLAPPMHLRINQQKTDRDTYLKLLAEHHSIIATAHPFSPMGITLEQAVDVDKLPHFAEGWCSVQDIAAQQAAVLLELKPNQRVLDACAAPGGKTAHILETEPSVDLLAIDQDATRLNRVQNTLSRLDLQAKLLTADASQADWWDKKPFDRILLDAPCSATGVIRRHPDIKWLRLASDIPALAELQLLILKNLWNMLAPNGILVYATCSILPEENDQIISQFLAETANAKTLALEFPRGCKTECGWQFFPEVMGTDGFYYSKLLKL